MKVETALEMLGYLANDAVTGLSGVITSISFDLCGCIQAILVPVVGEKGERKDGSWMDIGRLTIIGSAPVMEQPDYKIVEYITGPEEKPIK